jgi:methionyl-tRNA formyltransferase
MNIYIGNYHEVLKTFHHLKGVDHVISEKRNVENEIIDFCNSEKIQISLVHSSADINKVAEQIGSINLCIVASFGLILKKPFIDCTDLIINIHPGSLFNSRGRHPLPFAIRMGLPYMTITAHIIEDEKIDHGPVIMEVNIPLDYTGSYRDNDQRLRSCLPLITHYVVNNIDAKMNIPVLNADLTKSPYNRPIEKEELMKIMNSKTLESYKK